MALAKPRRRWFQFKGPRILMLLSAIAFVGGFLLPVTNPMVGGEALTGWQALQHCVYLIAEHRTLLGFAAGLAGILANLAMALGFVSLLAGWSKPAERCAIAAILLALGLFALIGQLVWNYPGYWVWLLSFALLLIASRPQFTFTLRTAFAILTVAAIALGCLGSEWKTLRDRNAMLRQLEDQNGIADIPPAKHNRRSAVEPRNMRNTRKGER